MIFKRSNTNYSKAFSLVELIIVVVILTLIGAIATPRLSSFSDTSKRSALTHANSSLQRAIDLYTHEHEGLLPHLKVEEVKNLRKRLTKKTTIDGSVRKKGTYGPYLDSIPINPYNGLNTIRSDGAAPGKGTHGWRYDRNSGQIDPDH